MTGPEVQKVIQGITRRQHLPGHGAQPLTDRRTAPVLPALTGPSMTPSRWPRRCGQRSMRRICNRRSDPCRGAVEHLPRRFGQGHDNEFGFPSRVQRCAYRVDGPGHDSLRRLEARACGVDRHLRYWPKPSLCNGVMRGLRNYSTLGMCLLVIASASTWCRAPSA